MTFANFKRVPIRSRKYLDGAKGETCKLRFVGVCNNDPETTVACHVHDDTFGLGQKADDISVIDGCSSCHAFLDRNWVGKISQTVLLRYILRGLQETLRNRIERGIAFIPLDIDRSAKAAKPRKPPAERVKIQSRSNWPKGRKIPSRPFPKQETTL